MEEERNWSFGDWLDVDRDMLSFECEREKERERLDLNSCYHSEAEEDRERGIIECDACGFWWDGFSQHDCPVESVEEELDEKKRVEEMDFINRFFASEM